MAYIKVVAAEVSILGPDGLYHDLNAKDIHNLDVGPSEMDLNQDGLPTVKVEQKPIEITVNIEGGKALYDSISRLQRRSFLKRLAQLFTDNMWGRN